MQAQTVFACASMDMVMNVSDNCKTNQDCVNMDFDDVVDLNQIPCFNQSVVLSIDQDLLQDLLVINAVVDSDIDPPDVIVDTIYRVFPRQFVLVFVAVPRTSLSGQSSSDTYLITQRLRI